MSSPAYQFVPDQLLADLAEGYLTLDAQWSIVYLNPAAARFTGLDPEAVTGTTIWLHFPELDVSYRAMLEEARSTGKVAEFESYNSARHEWRTVRVYPYVGGLRVLLHDQTGPRRAEEYGLRLLTVSDLLARAVTPHQVARAILEYAHATSEAYAGLVAVPSADGTALEVLETVGYRPEQLQGHQVMALGAALPTTDAFREQRSLFFSRSALLARYSHVQFSEETASLAVYPLIAAGTPAGVLAFSFPVEQEFSTLQRAYLQVLATQCAQALVRAQQHAEFLEHVASSRVILDTLDESLLLFDASGDLIAANAAAQRFFYLPSEAPLSGRLDLSAWDFRREDGTPLHLEDYPITCALRDGVTSSGILIQAIHPDGEQRWVSVNARPLYRPGEARPYASMASLADVTRQKTYELRLAHQASHDELTGLLNRQAFQDEVTVALQLSRGSAGQTAVMILDLDRFRATNDVYGGVTGDAVLCEVASRLNQHAGPRVKVARLGADEFGIMLSPVLSQQDAELFAQTLRGAVTVPITVQGQELHLTASLGLSLSQTSRDRASILTQRAYQALGAAQRRQGGQQVVYDAALAQVQERQTDLEHKLRFAIRDEQLHLAFQPILSLETRQTAGAEALLRWQHPDLGAVSPAEFIPLAEQRGLILSLGEWVLRQACLSARAWRSARVAVNVSRLQFHQPDFLEVVQRALLHSNLPADRLELEITETAVADDLDAGIRQLERLRRLGVRVALDDFGTGQSSLASLRLLPIDVLKLDRSFVADIETDVRQRAMVHAVVQLAAALGVEVVAEGIEAAGQRDLLRQLGCQYGQGYLFARPGPAAELQGL